MLSSQRVDLKETLYDTAKAKEREKEAAVNPLVQDGKKLVPSVNRVFSTGHEMYVFLEAYKPTPAAAGQPLFAFVSLYRASTKAFETAPIAVVPNPTSRLGKTLSELQPGYGRPCARRV